jgi:hypothetical protein
MTFIPFATAAVPAASVDTITSPENSTDSIRLGGGFRLPAVTPAPVADKSSIRLGGGFRLPAATPAAVADKGSIRLGGGFRLPSVRD